MHKHINNTTNNNNHFALSILLMSLSTYREPKRFACLQHSHICLNNLLLLLGLPLGLTPSTSQFFTHSLHSLSSFHDACSYHCNLQWCNTATSSSTSYYVFSYYVFCNRPIFQKSLQVWPDSQKISQRRKF